MKKPISKVLLNSLFGISPKIVDKFFKKEKGVKNENNFR